MLDGESLVYMYCVIFVYGMGLVLLGLSKLKLMISMWSG